MMEPADPRYPRLLHFRRKEMVGIEKDVNQPGALTLFPSATTLIVRPEIEGRKGRQLPLLSVTMLQTQLKEVLSELGPIEGEIVVVQQDRYMWFARVMFKPGTLLQEAVLAKEPRALSIGKKKDTVRLHIDFIKDADEEIQDQKRVSFSVIMDPDTKTHQAVNVIRLHSKIRGVSVLRCDDARNHELILDYRDMAARRDYHDLYNYLRKFHERQLNIKFTPLTDSGSLFTALSHQLFGTPDNGEFVRQQCVQHMQKHGDYYRQFVDIDFEYYLSRKKTRLGWGDHLDLQAVAEMYDLQVKF
jgi:hypothetical protein